MQAIATATRTPSATPAYISKRLGAHDPWAALCSRCGLPDCIRTEGDFQAIPPKKWRTYPGCAIWEAATRGWTPTEALERGGEIGEIGLIDE
jgi:hypothetical protein